jgi:hypothetical protein
MYYGQTLHHQWCKNKYLDLILFVYAVFVFAFWVERICRESADILNCGVGGTTGGVIEGEFICCSLSTSLP